MANQKKKSAKQSQKSAPKKNRGVQGSKARRVSSAGLDEVVLRTSLLELIRKTSCELPDDVVRAVAAAKKVERSQSQDSRASYALGIIEDNIDLAKIKSGPLCQDTGTILFFIHYPMTVKQKILEKALLWAVRAATKKGYLRQNSVDSVTGENSGDNVGPGTPVIHMEPWDKPHFDVRLMLKGGGCENVGAQYSLPDIRIGAGRDLEGVRRCILDAVSQAQGKGCGPGVLAVTIGGDRATGYAETKKLFLQTMGTRSKDPTLAQLEKVALDQCNQLGVGPMGFGGKTTLLDVMVSKLNRLPASYFVSISYMCWAFRRQGVALNPRGAFVKWLYK